MCMEQQQWYIIREREEGEIERAGGEEEEGDKKGSERGREIEGGERGGLREICKLTIRVDKILYIF